VDVVVLFSGPRHCGVPARPAWQPLRGRLGLSPSCRPAAHHIARLLHTYRMARLWLWHTYHMALMALMALMASCQQPSHACHANSHHMSAYATTITCHAYATPIPRLHRARARAARRHRAAGPTSSQRACGAGQVQCTRQARRRTSEGAAGYGTEEMGKGEMKDLADGLTLRLRELLAH
jgi:hypothetical protein